MISAVLLATASVGITASAEETASENQETTAVIEMTESTEKTTETTITDTSENPTEITDTATSETTENPTETTTVDYFGDDYYDTAGNATLIKKESIIYDSEEMHFFMQAMKKTKSLRNKLCSLLKMQTAECRIILKIRQKTVLRIPKMKKFPCLFRHKKIP